MENKTYSSSPAIQVYGKKNRFELPSHTDRWKTNHILAPQPYRSMEKTQRIIAPQPYRSIENKAYASPLSHTGLWKT